MSKKELPSYDELQHWSIQDVVDWLKAVSIGFGTKLKGRSMTYLKNRFRLHHVLGGYVLDTS